MCLTWSRCGVPDWLAAPLQIRQNEKPQTHEKKPQTGVCASGRAPKDREENVERYRPRTRGASPWLMSGPTEAGGAVQKKKKGKEGRRRRRSRVRSCCVPGLSLSGAGVRRGWCVRLSGHGAGCRGRDPAGSFLRFAACLRGFTADEMAASHSLTHPASVPLPNRTVERRSEKRGGKDESSD